MSRTVLIVEDEANLAELLTDMLHTAGYEVVLTTAGKAVERTEEVVPAAIVLDFVMPGMNGDVVVEQIRKQLGNRTPPVMLVSGLPNVRELAVKTRADAYLRKPFDVDAFLRVVDRLVASG